MSKPTALERAVLLAVAEQLVPQLKESLIEQIGNASVVKRENTGGGFYTYFDVGNGPYGPLPALTHVEVGANVEGLLHGMGFIAWIKDGHLDCLEGYSYEEATALIDWERASFELVDLRRKYLS